MAGLQLAAVRKVLSEHTAEDRLAYIIGKIAGVDIPYLLPPVTMFGKADVRDAVQPFVDAYRRQTYAGKCLVLVLPDGVTHETGSDSGISTLTATEAGTVSVADLGGENVWLAPLHPGDHYGPGYLLDLALATRYAPGAAIGKASHHVRRADGTIMLHDADSQYRLVDSLPVRASCQRASGLTCTVEAFLADIDSRYIDGDSLLSIDAFNYCREGRGGDAAVAAMLDALPDVDTGMGIATLTAAAESIRLIERPLDTLTRIEGSRLATMFRSGPFVAFASDGDGLRVESKLDPDQRRQRYTKVALTPAELGVVDGVLRAHVIATPGLPIRIGLRFIDAAGAEIGTASSDANFDMTLDLPDGTAGVHIGLRVVGPGTAHIEALIVGHRFLEPTVVLSCGDYLILTDRFPSYGDPSQGTEAFEAAVAARFAGRRPDVFCFAAVEATAYHEYEGIECITGAEEVLAALIAGGHHRHVEIISSDAAMRAILSRHAEGAGRHS